METHGPIHDEQGRPLPRVSDEEAIGYADGRLATLLGVDGRPVTEWRGATDAARDAARKAWGAEPIEIEGVRLEVGRVYDVLIRKRYGTGKTLRRRVYLGRRASRGWRGEPVEVLDFGAALNSSAWGNRGGESPNRDEVAGVVDVTSKVDAKKADERQGGSVDA